MVETLILIKCCCSRLLLHAEYIPILFTTFRVKMPTFFLQSSLRWRFFKRLMLDGLSDYLTGETHYCTCFLLLFFLHKVSTYIQAILMLVQNCVAAIPLSGALAKPRAHRYHACLGAWVWGGGRHPRRWRHFLTESGARRPMGGRCNSTWGMYVRALLHHKLFDLWRVCADVMIWQTRGSLCVLIFYKWYRRFCIWSNKKQLSAVCCGWAVAVHPEGSMQLDCDKCKHPVQIRINTINQPWMLYS